MDNNSQDKNNFLDASDSSETKNADSSAASDSDAKSNKNSSAYDSESDIIWERKAPADSRHNTGNSEKRVIRTQSGSTENKSETERAPQRRAPDASKRIDTDTFDETIIYDALSVRKNRESEKKSDGPDSAGIPVHRTRIQSSLKRKPQNQYDDEDKNVEKSETKNRTSDKILTSVPYETRQINTQQKRKGENGNDTGEVRRNDIPSGKNDADGRKRPISKSASVREIPKNELPVSDSRTSTKVVQVRSDGSGSAPVPEVGEEEAVDISDKDRKKKKAEAKRRRKESGEGASTVLSVVWAIIYIVLVVVTGVFLGLGIVFVGNDVFAFVKEDIIVEVEIPEYATLNEVTDIFYDEGLIKYKLIFRMWANLRDKDNNVEFLAGTYQLSPAMNYDELRTEIRPKYTRNTIRLTIPEGYTTDEIIDLFTSSGIGTKETFIDVINNYDFKAGGYNYWFIDELQTNGYSSDRFYRLDGYLFPDTYDFYSDSSEVAVIAKLLDNFEVKFNSTYAARAEELGMTADQIVILASIVEKEARYIEDLPVISSVFHNRLKNSSVFPKFESDATIIYAMHHDTGVRPTSLSSEGKYYDTPYNSYTHNGLPPGAIANPGLEAIKYALYPDETEYYYFVSDIYGYVYYASTLAEQNYNINLARSVE